MILNVSGRCDIVAFYMPWFMNRLKAGFVDVRNPFNKNLISRINFDDVDLIFFCTKNPIPLLKYINEINKKVYIHVTITPYKDDIEPNVPLKKDIIDAVKKLSDIFGKENIVIRYDPVFISQKYSLNYHIKAFDELCKILDGYIDKILISFLDEYKNVLKNKDILKYRSLTEADYKSIGINFSKSAKNHGMVVHTCFEKRDLVEYGFVKDECMPKILAYKLTGKIFKEEWKARKERLCHCVQMVDIGVYNSCKHFCKYCYANYSEEEVLNNYNNHNPNSSLLVGEIDENDVIKERKK